MAAHVDARAPGEALVGEVQRRLEEVESLPDGPGRDCAAGVMSALLALYEAGLERIVEEVSARDDGEIAAALAGDELVSHLLMLHGLHPVGVEDRVRGALDSVRPYLESHGGGVELVAVDEGVVRVSLRGSCHGCPSSTMTLKLAIEEAVHKAAPEIVEVVAEEPDASGSPLIQLEVAPAAWAEPCPLPEMRAAPEPVVSAGPEPVVSGGPEPEAEERCDLCGAPIPADHGHVLELPEHELRCACRPCSLLFTRDGAGSGARRLVPDRRLRLGETFDDLAWEELRIPVGIAFFVRDSVQGRVLAFYPGPMGATESQLGLDAWADVERGCPALAGMEDDVEALLVNRARGARQSWLVPIDEPYRLVALIRTHWRGFGGGREVWGEIERFFDELDRRARPAVEGMSERSRTWPTSAPATAT